LAHWTFTQRTIHVALANKTPVLRYEKHILTGTVGDAIYAARKQAGMTQEQLAQAAGVSRYWLGRWERGRALPAPTEWNELSRILRLPHCVELLCK
jgi:ribosome-binding protein aMBF1 (putative translation factor)